MRTSAYLSVLIGIFSIQPSFGFGEKIDPRLIAKPYFKAYHYKSQGPYGDDEAIRLQLSPSGAHVAKFTKYAGLEIFERESGKMIFSDKFAKPRPSGDTLKWSPSGNLFLFRDPQTGALHIHRAKDGWRIATFTAPKHATNYGKVVFSPDDRYALSLFEVENKNNFRIHTEAEVWLLDGGHAVRISDFSSSKAYSGKRKYNHGFDSAVFSRDSRYIITKTKDSSATMAVWSLSGDLIRKHEDVEYNSFSRNPLLPEELSPTAPEVMIRASGHKTVIWNYETGHTVTASEFFRDPGYYHAYEFLRFSNDGELVFHPQFQTPNGNDTLDFKSTTIYSAKTGQTLKKISGNRAFPLPDGKHLITWLNGDGRNGYAVWSLTTFDLLRFYPCNQKVGWGDDTWNEADVGDADVIKPILSPDGKKIISLAGCMAAQGDAHIEEIEIDTIVDFSMERIPDAVRETGKRLYQYRQTFLNQFADIIPKFSARDSKPDSREAYTQLFSLELMKIYLTSLDSKTLKESLMPGFDRRIEEYRSVFNTRGISDMGPSPEIRKLALQTITLSLISLQAFSMNELDSQLIARLKSLSALAQANPNDIGATQRLVSELSQAQAFMDRMIANNRTSGNAELIDALKNYLSGAK